MQPSRFSSGDIGAVLSLSVIPSPLPELALLLPFGRPRIHPRRTPAHVPAARPYRLEVLAHPIIDGLLCLENDRSCAHAHHVSLYLSLLARMSPKTATLIYAGGQHLFCCCSSLAPQAPRCQLLGSYAGNLFPTAEINRDSLEQRTLPGTIDMSQWA